MWGLIMCAPVSWCIWTELIPRIDERIKLWKLEQNFKGQGPTPKTHRFWTNCMTRAPHWIRTPLDPRPTCSAPEYKIYQWSQQGGWESKFTKTTSHVIPQNRWLHQLKLHQLRSVDLVQRDSLLSIAKGTKLVIGWKWLSLGRPTPTERRQRVGDIMFQRLRYEIAFRGLHG